MRCLSLLSVAALAVMAFAAPTINPNTLTVSGISAGAAFAVQYEIAHSSKVHAAGVIAGLPFYCAGSSGVGGAYECMDDPSLINVNELNDIISLYASAGDVDAVANLKQHAVMLFSGLIDTVVNHGAMEALQTQYTALGVTNLITFFNYTAEHAWITNYAGNSCSNLGSPYINNCGLDFAGQFLSQAFKQLSLPFNENRGTFNSANLYQFSQTSFGANELSNSMDNIGYYYIPSGCSSSSNNTCHVHINFHGCTQGESSLGTEYVTYTGLNEWAEANNIIIVYPQIVANSLLENPNGCFDWWGYAGSNYATKAGTQMKIVESIVETIMTNGVLPSPTQK